MVFDGRVLKFWASQQQRKINGIISYLCQTISLKNKLVNQPPSLIQKHFMCLSLLSVQLTKIDEKWTKLVLFQSNSLLSVVFTFLNQVTWPQLPKSWELSPNWTLFTLIRKPHILFFTHSPDFSRCCLLMCLRTWDVSIMAQRNRLSALFVFPRNYYPFVTF